MKRAELWVAILMVWLLLVSCSSPTIRDGAPDRDIDVSLIPDAVPKVEPITSAGNKSPYVVFGRTYHVLPESRGYQQRGGASWYGTKFHGRKTSNGETYDMYAMTGAHKSLPIPSYVQVTNLKNGRKVIVRINDRGPFHSSRIIDLSYVAAKKLGYDQHGTSDVEVVAIDPVKFQHNSVEVPRMAFQRPKTGAPLPGKTFLQAGAFSARASAEEKRVSLSRSTGYPVEVRESRVNGRTLFKVLVGPIADQNALADMRTLLLRTENLSSFVVRD